ncbi:Arylesterase [Oceanobacter sp. RED65]|uniref:Arylesterase n=2 Tax=Bermanella marisrubri TaxID=207949 RepID=Q1N150_9GAMM|nr:Arylesterase [Oceanobacter sp. RED65] [Bermanella marisrubri]
MTLFFLASATVWSASDKILVLGDSLSAGYGIKVQESWPKLLDSKLETEDQNYKVHNASISGQTTSEGLRQIDELLSLTSPKLVILELGANDGLRGLSISAMKSNLNSMIDKSQLAGAKVLLLGIQVPTNYGPRYGQMFKQAFADVAEQQGVAFIPFMLKPLMNNKDKYVQDDGLHPNAIAQPVILDYLWPEIEALL